ncbi:MAG: PKD domain-containing protein, partial [Bdellovibrionota bacterium]
MKSKLLAIALSFLPALGANAQDLGRREISALTHRIEAGRNRIYKKIHGKNGTRVLHYYISPDHPVQGDSVTLFAEVQTDFTGEELLLQGSFDGAAATLEQPTTDLFVANLGVFNQISSHKFQGQIFIQSHSDAEQLRNAISQLNTQISSLNAQIAATTDPTLLAQLQAQLAQAQAEQAQLTQSLINLKSPVDEEDFSFEVQANTSSQNFPHISGISPSVGFLNSAAQITISGTNFSANPVVTLGGQSVTVSSSSATSIVGHVSGFSTTGPKDLEVDFSNAGQATNAVLKGGFFVTDTALGNSAPVAVASASAAQINLGSAANFVSTGSNDPQNGGLAFQWQLISVPSGSHVPVPSAGTSASYSITPDVPGAYVASLVVSSSLSNLASAPSLAVVQVAAPANQAPVLTGGSISLNTQATATLQLGLSDESWQAHSYLITRAPGHGSATVSSTGLVSYSAGSTTTTDSFDVMVLDNGTPPLSASVTIPVSILASHPPVASAPPITVAPGVAGASQVNAYAFDSGKTVTIALSNQPANGTATISSSGLVTYAPNSGFSGADSIGVVVTDSGTPPLSTSISIPVMVSSLTPPSIPNFLAYRIFVANSPFQVGMAVNSAQPQQIVAGNGGVASVVWDFGDGSHEKIADFLYAGMTHYYVNPGSFTATLTVTDRAGLTASLSQQVVVASIPVPIVRVSMNPSTGGAAPLSVTLDASASTVSSGAISEYHWQFCGVNPETVTTAPTITHSFATTCTVRVRAFGPTGLLGQGGGVAAGSANIVVPVGNAVSGA